MQYVVKADGEHIPFMRSLHVPCEKVREQLNYVTKSLQYTTMKMCTVKPQFYANSVGF